MRKFLIVSAAAMAFGLFALSAPANAGHRDASGVTASDGVQVDLSARRYYRRYYYRHPYYYRRHYYGHYYRPYRYYYWPRYYYPYPYYYPYGYYYRRPGIYFGFGW